MDRYTAKIFLKQAFSVLSDYEKENLLWHAENGTRILCGQEASFYTTDDGGA